jgi:hypothetical protein
MSTTHFCPECARPVRTKDASDGEIICRRCGAAVGRGEHQRWVNVARVANLAEAGFLVDELSGEGVTARIYQSEDFNALTDRWSVSYLIQSSAEEAHAVAARIRQHLADIDSRRGDHEEADDIDAEDSLADPVFWRPVAVVVLAGMASFALGQRFGHERGEPRLPPRDSLARAVSAIGRPLVTEAGPGLPRNRLSYQARDHAWLLDTDADGDGIYESHQRFQTTGADW